MNHAGPHYVIHFVSLQEGTMAYDVEILGLVLEGIYPDISCFHILHPTFFCLQARESCFLMFFLLFVLPN
jgi:hypothetical protein